MSSPRRLLLPVLAVALAPAHAAAMSFLPCPANEVEVPPNPVVIVEGHDGARVDVDSAPAGASVSRSVTPIDHRYARVELDLAAGDRAEVSGFMGPRCSGRTFKVVADWTPDRTPPPAPTAAPYGGDQVELAWDAANKHRTWWTRLEWARTPDALARGRGAWSIATWIAWIDLAPGERVHVRMVRMLPDGSDSTPWHGVVKRDRSGAVTVTPTKAPTRTRPARPRGA